MTYMWQDNRPGYGWLTADGQESIKLPDGRAAWFFSDVCVCSIAIFALVSAISIFSNFSISCRFIRIFGTDLPLFSGWLNFLFA